MGTCWSLLSQGQVLEILEITMVPVVPRATTNWWPRPRSGHVGPSWATGKFWRTLATLESVATAESPCAPGVTAGRWPKL